MTKYICGIDLEAFAEEPTAEELATILASEANELLGVMSDLLRKE